MPDHLIHLRRAWTAEGGGPARVDLPTTWGDGAIPSRLVRSFQGPRLAHGLESLWLRLESVAGLRFALLNGDDLGPIPESDGRWEVAIPAWKKSGNRLELGVDPADTPRGESWGKIALVIRS